MIYRPNNIIRPDDILFFHTAFMGRRTIHCTQNAYNYYISVIGTPAFCTIRKSIQYRLELRNGNFLLEENLTDAHEETLSITHTIRILQYPEVFRKDYGVVGRQ